MESWISGLEVVVIMYRNKSSVYTGYCVVNHILSVSKGCLEFVESVQVQSDNMG